MEQTENPGRLAYINEISDQLTRLAVWVESANKSNRTDLAVVSEDIVGGLLNLIFKEEGWMLVNTNTPDSPNFPGIDLADEELCIGVQVTANNTLDKVKDMLTKFSSHHLDRLFTRLILVELTSQDATPGMKKRCTEQFNGSRDIWNIPYLLRLIQSIQSIERLEEITYYLQKQVGDLYRKVRKPSDTQKTAEEKTSHPAPARKKKVSPAPTNRKQEKTSGFMTEMNQAFFWSFVILMVLGIIVSFFPLQEMPAELSGYNVTINGASVSVPTTFQQLEALGWTAEDPGVMDEWIAPYSAAFYRTDLTNGHGSFTVGYENPSAHTLQVKDCVITTLVFHAASFDSSYIGESVNTLEAPLGLKLGVSKWSERNAFPYGHDKTKRSTYIQYSYEPKNSKTAYKFSFNRPGRYLATVEIHNSEPEAMAKFLGRAYDTAAPAYDADTLQAWLGVTMNIHCDGFDYPVLCTVDTYGELNYTIDRTPEYVTSAEHNTLYLRGDALHKASLEIYNPFPRALTPENCFIGCFDTRQLDGSSEPFVLTCTTADQTVTIAEGMTRDELTTALDSAQIQWSNSGVETLTFYPNPRLDTLSVICKMSDKGLLYDCTVDGCNALQNYFFQNAS